MGSKKRKKETIKAVPVIEPIRIPIWEKRADLLAPLLILVLLVIFFQPLLFGHKTLLPPDSSASASYNALREQARSEGVYPLWNPYIMCGMPAFASLSIAPGVDVVNVVIRTIVSPFSDSQGGFAGRLLNFFIMGGLMYLLLRSRKISPAPALFASLALVFLPQVVAYPAFGHNTKLATITLAPVIFLAAERLLEKRNLFFFGLYGLVSGLQLLRNHLQICYYTQMMVILFFIFWAIWNLRQDKKWGTVLKGFGLLAGAMVIGTLVSAVINLSVWEYAHYSIRGGGTGGGLDYGYATNWSFPPAEIVTFLIPSFMGFGGATYWGSMPFTDFPIYFGIVTLFLGGLALVIRRDKLTLFFGFLALFALVLSFGKYLPLLYGPMFKLAPFFSKFRSPKMINIIIGFSLCFLSGLAIEALIQAGEESRLMINRRLKRYALIFGGLLALVFIALLLARPLYLGWADKLGNRAARAYDMAVSDGFRSLLLLGGTVIFAMAAAGKSRIRTLAPFALIIILLIDLWPVSRRFMHIQPRTDLASYFQATPEIDFLKKQEGVFRIFTMGDSRQGNWFMYHRLQNVGGYNTARLKIYQNFMERFIWPNGIPILFLKSRPDGRGWVARSQDEITPKLRQAYHAFLKISNVKYVVTPFRLSALDTSMMAVFAPGQNYPNGIYQFKDFLPRVFFPDSVLTVPDEAHTLDFIANGGMDPAKIAVIDQEPEYRIEPSPNRKAEISEYGLQRIQIDAEVDRPSLLVLSDAYYPKGWRVLVDGVEKRIYQTDYLIRSVFLDAGKHQVEFIFAPADFSRGLFLSLISGGLLICCIGAGLFLQRKKRKG